MINKFNLVLAVLVCAISFSFSTTIQAEDIDHDDHKHQEKTHEHSDLDHHDDARNDHKDHESKVNHHDDHDDHGDHDEEIVRLSEQQLRAFNIQLEKVTSKTLNVAAQFPGEVKVHLDHKAYVTPRFPGVVESINVHIGDTVKKGQLLATIESNESLTKYEIRSPLSGQIIEKNITLGRSVREDAEVFLVANLDTVWIDIGIYQKYLPEIKKGAIASISLDPHHKAVKSRIEYVSPLIDEHTRTGLARISISNKVRQFYPGQFIVADIVLDRHKAKKAVENSAIQRYENSSVVFVKTKDGFEPVPVKLGESDKKFVEILSGLDVGQTYVSDGSFIIKAQLEKASFDDGHNH